jgi:HD-GYP domain-containing protein (c-di-GMP phosphodiesterase class II)
MTQQSELAQRLRQIGLLMLNCTPEGELVALPHDSDDWLAELFYRAPLFHQALREAARQWQGESEPKEREVLPGLWLVPVPLVGRRRRVGYAVAAVPTAAFLQAEQLPAICQAARQDVLMTRTLLMQLSPPNPTDVPRLASLVRFAHEDQMRLSADSEAMETVGKQLGESYEEINLLYTIIRSMTVEQKPSRFISIACSELLATLPYAWIGAQLVDDPKTIKGLSGRLVVAGEPAEAEDALRDAMKRVLHEAQADAPIVLEPGFNDEHAEYAALGKTALIHPVTSDGDVIGVLVAGDKQGPDPAASSVDIKLLGATATHMAIFLKNAALYDDLNAMFFGTLEALTASIDAKDRYTCGHSERVAHLTQQLAAAAGLDEYTVGRMRIAGLVHDVGKIGVPEAVLTKPGKLTEEEFDAIKKHPEIGHRILKDIPQLHDVLPGVLYHHERWDGAGYPHGLAGLDIPPIARLIALADSFDAMSSTRTYRAQLSRHQVIDEIRQCSGSQFDPELSPIFIGLDFTDYDRLVCEHQEAEQRRASQGEAA